MNDPVRWTGQMPSTPNQAAGSSPARQGGRDSTNLADILERVLDKGIVIAGDVQINLLDIELLTIKLRLIVASVDRAKEMGIDWWERDPTLSSGHQELEEENRRLRERLEALEGRDGHAPSLGRGPDEPDDAEVEDEADDLDDAEIVDDDFDEDEAPEDEAPEDEAPQDEAPQDEAPQDEAPQDEAPQDEDPQDEAPQDEDPQDEAGAGEPEAAREPRPVRRRSDRSRTDQRRPEQQRRRRTEQ